MRAAPPVSNSLKCRVINRFWFMPKVYGMAQCFK